MAPSNWRSDAATPEMSAAASTPSHLHRVLQSGLKLRPSTSFALSWKFQKSTNTRTLCGRRIGATGKSTVTPLVDNRSRTKTGSPKAPWRSNNERRPNRVARRSWVCSTGSVPDSQRRSIAAGPWAGSQSPQPLRGSCSAPIASGGSRWARWSCETRSRRPSARISLRPTPRPRPQGCFGRCAP